VRGLQGRGRGRAAREEAAVLAPVPRRVHRAVAPGAQLVPALPLRAAYRRPGVRDLESRADRGCLNQLRG